MYFRSQAKMEETHRYNEDQKNLETDNVLKTRAKETIV